MRNKTQFRRKLRFALQVNRSNIPVTRLYYFSFILAKAINGPIDTNDVKIDSGKESDRIVGKRSNAYVSNLHYFLKYVY